MKDILTVCKETAMEAGLFLKENFNRKIEKIDRKADQSLVTNLDKEAERLIISRIKADFPGHGIIGEEGGASSTDSEYVWIIDPLDGTHNYIHRIPLFGVSVGVARNEEFIAGAVYMPMTDELYYAEKGAGAYKNDGKISVSKTADFSNCTVSFDSDVKTDPDRKLPVLKTLAQKAFNIRMFGASTINLTYLAEGKLDIIIEFNDKPWDFAGSACIIEEAGGKITAFEGGRLTYKNYQYIATNGLVHQELLNMISK